MPVAATGAPPSTRSSSPRQGDAPSAELQARVRDPISLAGSYGSGLILVALLAIMIWKPGA